MDEEYPLLFSQRLSLEQAFDEWRKMAYVMGHEMPSIAAMNVVGFLDQNGLIDRKAAKEFLAKRQGEQP